jgi:hypothetical protein
MGTDTSNLDIRKYKGGTKLDNLARDNTDKQYLYARKDGHHTFGTDGYTAGTENARKNDDGKYIAYENPFYEAPVTTTSTGGGGGGGGGGGKKKKSSGGGGPAAPAAPAVEITKPTFDFMNQTKAALAPKPDTPLEARAKEFLDKSFAVNEKWLKGELTDDVTAAVMRASSEAANLLGIGTGQKARMLSARDLGVTSQVMIEKGLAGGTALAEQVDKMKRLDQQYALNVQQVIRDARALDLSQWEVRNKLAIEAEKLAVEKSLGLAELALKKDQLGISREELKLKQDMWDLEKAERLAPTGGTGETGETDATGDWPSGNG